MVRDRATGQPLAGVTVAAPGMPFRFTNAEGTADLTGMVAYGPLTFRLEGYADRLLPADSLQRTGFIVWLEFAGLALDQVVISASRWLQPGHAAPGRVIGLSAADIAFAQPQTSADLLAATGEVFIQKSQQGGGSPMIRGFAANRLLYAVDGVRMNTAIFRSGNLQNVISIDPFEVDRAEVLFGPGSVMYGSDAIGGVMHFQTLTPRFSDKNTPLTEGAATARISSANREQTAHLHAAIGWKRWALLVSATHADFGDLRMGRFGPDAYLRPWYVQRIDSTDRIVTNPDPLVQRPTAYAQFNGMAKLRFAPRPNWDLQLALRQSATTDYDRYDRLLLTRRGLPRSAEWRYGPQVWRMAVFSVDHRRKTLLYDAFSLKIASQLFEESRIDRNFNDPIRRSRVETVNAWSANADLRKRISHRAELFFGGETVWNHVASSGRDLHILTGVLADGPARYPQADWFSAAAYASAQWQWAEKWALQAGARYNAFGLDAVFDTRFYPFPFETSRSRQQGFTGQTSVTWRPSAQWVISGSLANGFRAPNVDDSGKVFDSQPGAVITPNPNLGAEYAWNAELNASRRFGAVRAEVTAYYTLLDGAMVRRNFTLNGLDSIEYSGVLSQVQAIQNAAQARVFGLLAAVDGRWPSGWGFSSRFNYQRGREQLDDGTESPLRHAGPWFGITRVHFTQSRYRLEANVQYSGAVPWDRLPEEARASPHLFAPDANGNPWSPGWYTVNVRAEFRVTSQVSVFSGAENLTDQRYRTYSSGLAAPGRNVSLAVRMSW